MATVFRVVGAIVVGMFVAFILVIAVEFFSAIVHPLPADFGGTTEEMCKHVERYPHWVLAVVVPAWAATAFAGTWIAGRLGNLGSGIFIGAFLLAAVVFNISMLPYPIWFKIACLIAIPCGILLALYLLNRNVPALHVTE